MTTPENRINIREDGALPFLVNSINGFKSKVYKEVIRAIRACTISSKSTDNAKYFTQYNLLSEIEKRFAIEEDYEVLSDMAIIIGNCALDEQSREKMLIHGILKKLIDLCRSSDEKVQSSSVCALANCAMSEKNQEVIRKANLFPDIVEALHSMNPYTRIGAILIIRNFARIGSDSQSENWNLNVEKFLRLGVLEKLISLFNNFDQTLNDLVSETLEFLSKNSKIQKRLQELISQEKSLEK
ncbi:armadillo repeat-containing protein 4 armc4 [Anaeramoeba ignava]|uniref:Armadillo repeat-containing protein 4 armc4 n=1 Tax=Anaeramoeba ignava TaxID=1746090 RepID=A0A9Q0LQ52_ANAIG|nr:armadillo repeat-containing protein 4 armc4 [Anaeramoeba ignava]